MNWKKNTIPLAGNMLNYKRNSYAYLLKIMAKRRIIITAGHNGKGTGAASKWLDEGAENIVLRDAITAKLRAFGCDVTNDTNTEKTGTVIGWINRLFAPESVLIEIHFNASSYELATGTECFIQAKSSGIERELADKICKITTIAIDVRNRGVKSPDLSQHSTIGVLDKTNVHAVLWEVCFLSNKQDVIRYQKYKENLILGVATAIHNTLLQ